jgi:NhaP-type Na+/H+ or K+/H+ antiporter
MDIFASEILSYKSIYLIALGVYITLILTPLIYRITKRKWKPKVVAIPIVLFVTFFHLHIAGLSWDASNIFKSIFLAILTYAAAFGLAASIASIVRTTDDPDERDMTFGKKG